MRSLNIEKSAEHLHCHKVVPATDADVGGLHIRMNYLVVELES